MSPNSEFIISPYKYYNLIRKCGLYFHSRNLINWTTKKFIKRYLSSCGTKGLLDPKDIVGTITFLLSNSSEFINGQNIIVDDGWSL